MRVPPGARLPSFQHHLMRASAATPAPLEQVVAPAAHGRTVVGASRSGAHLGRLVVDAGGGNLGPRVIMRFYACKHTVENWIYQSNGRFRGVILATNGLPCTQLFPINSKREIALMPLPPDQSLWSSRPPSKAPRSANTLAYMRRRH